MRGVCLLRCVGRNEAAGHAVHSKRSGGRLAMAEKSAREAVFQSEFLQDLQHWVRVDRNIALRVLGLVEAIVRDPFQGIGKPEPLRYVFAGC
jgi:hypothetical protein